MKKPMSDNERQRIVTFVLHGCSLHTIDMYIRNHPDLSQLDRQLDEFYILPR